MLYNPKTQYQPAITYINNKLFKASSILLTIMISMVKGFLIITIVSNTLNDNG